MRITPNLAGSSGTISEGLAHCIARAASQSQQTRALIRLAIVVTIVALVSLVSPLLLSRAQATPSAIPQFTPLAQEAQEDGSAEDSDQAPQASSEPGEALSEDEGDETSQNQNPDTSDGTEDPGSDARASVSFRGGARPSGSSPAAPSTQAGKSEKSLGERIAGIARKYEGYRYAWAGTSPRTGFDCSGLDSYVYREAGLSIPAHDLEGQLNTGPRVPQDQLQPGDLVFFQNTYTYGLSHGGIYLGNGMFISAVDEHFGVWVSNLLDEYWGPRFVGASRPWDQSPGR